MIATLEVAVLLEEASARMELRSKQLSLRAAVEAVAITERQRQYRFWRKRAMEAGLKARAEEVQAARIAAESDGKGVRDLR
ncbi:MAG TPA: hypothetical protein VLC92_21920 [Rhodocyclaceae bacterium]|nr:hypothetical protein [Rhodocyclaceae bacterium]